MLQITLGTIIGLLLAIIVSLAVRKYQTPIERVLKQTENRLKEKGAIFIESEDEEDLKAFLNSLPKE